MIIIMLQLRCVCMWKKKIVFVQSIIIYSNSLKCLLFLQDCCIRREGVFCNT